MAHLLLFICHHITMLGHQMLLNKLERAEQLQTFLASELASFFSLNMLSTELAQRTIRQTK